MPKFAWKDEYIVSAYQFAVSGMSDPQIASALGVSTQTVRKWRKRRSVFDDAIRRGRKARRGKSKETLADYIYDRLSIDMQQLWDELEACQKEDNALEMIEALFANRGVNARQRMFVHALVSGLYNQSEACRKVGIPKAMFDKWVQNDPDFVEMIREIEWHKKNFLENALLELVKEGNPLAVVHAAKTALRDRGYGEKVDYNIQGTLTHMAGVVDIDALEIPLETRRAMLDQIRGRAGQPPTETKKVEARLIEHADA